MDRLVEQLSTYASEMRYDELPEQVTHQAKRLLVDALGCAIGGFEGEPSRLARGLAGTVSSSRPATVLVSGQSTSPDMAAFANGVMVRYPGLQRRLFRPGERPPQRNHRRCPLLRRGGPGQRRDHNHRHGAGL